jgi:hypothetical protein
MPQRKDFESVAAAVRFAVATLSAREMPEIRTADVTLRWPDIKAFAKGLNLEVAGI